MSLIVAGIDEAGYGPLLGPLTVGLTVFRLADWSPGDAAPDLWDRLCSGACRKPSDKLGRVAVDDSKRLKLPNQHEASAPGEPHSSASAASPNPRHPLRHLERGVLAFLAAKGERPQSDAELFASLGIAGEAANALPWYQRPACRVPISWSASEIGIAGNLLARSFAESGVELLSIGCRAVHEDRFNAITERTGTKAAVTANALVGHLHTVWNTWADVSTLAEDPSMPPPGPRVVCDIQGGRRRYARLLERAFPGAQVRTLEESPRRSRYVVNGLSETGIARVLTVILQPEAEKAHLPVALASMTAKLVRELMMARFNQYWIERSPGLRPTAGYRQDAKRWLQDAAEVITVAERELMIRRA